MVGGVAEEVFFGGVLLIRGDLHKGVLAVPGMVGGQDVGAVGSHAADDQIAVELGDAPDADADILLVGGVVFLGAGKAGVDLAALIGGGVHLPDAGVAQLGALGHGAAEIQFAVVLHSVAQGAGLAGGGPGHQHLHLPGVDVELHQDAAGVGAVLFAVKEGAVVQRFQLGGHYVLVKGLPQDGVHHVQGLGQGGVVGGDIEGAPIGDGGPGIALAPGALPLVIGGHGAVPQIVHQAVGLLEGGVGVGKFLEQIACAAVRIAGRKGCCQDAEGGGDRQQGGGGQDCPPPGQLF